MNNAAIISEPITSTEQWHQLRAGNVGASEIGALFGCHDYLTAYGLAARKLGRLENQIDNAVLRRGRLLEPVAKQLLAEEKPDWQPIEAVSYFYDPSIRLGATPDHFVRTEAGLGVIQIKTVAPAQFAQKWHNADGAIEPPLWIALQAMVEQHLTGADFAMIAVLKVGYGITVELVEVPYLPDVIDQARERVVAFWQMVDRGELPAPDYQADRGNLAQVYRDDDGSELDLTGDNELPEIIAQWEALKLARGTAQDGIDEAEAKIKHRLGHAERARYAGGLITWKTVDRKGYTVAPSSYRKLAVKPDKRARA